MNKIITIHARSILLNHETESRQEAQKEYNTCSKHKTKSRQKTEDSTEMVASAEKRQHEEHGRNLPVDVRRRGGQGWSPATSLRVKVKGEVVVVPPV
jgi:hypothetical protein